MAAPLVKGTKSNWQKYLAALVYVVALGSAAVLVSVSIASLGAAAREWHPAAGLTFHRILLVVGLASFAYAVREAGVLDMPLPTSSWQVPATWTRFGLFPSMGLFGAAVGPGFLTRTAYPAYAFMIIWDALLGAPAFGLVVGLLYAAGRSLGVVAAAFAASPETAVDLPHHFRPWSEASHYVNALILGALSSYAVIWFVLT